MVIEWGHAANQLSWGLAKEHGHGAGDRPNKSHVLGSYERQIGVNRPVGTRVQSLLQISATRPLIGALVEVIGSSTQPEEDGVNCCESSRNIDGRRNFSQCAERGAAGGDRKGSARQTAAADKFMLWS